VCFKPAFVAEFARQPMLPLNCIKAREKISQEADEIRRFTTPHVSIANIVPSLRPNVSGKYACSTSAFHNGR
jgi:hypothetical protein